MTTQVMITWSDEVYQQAIRVARLAHRDVEIVVSDSLEWSIPEMRSTNLEVVPVSILSDAQVLELTSEAVKRKLIAPLEL